MNLVNLTPFSKAVLHWFIVKIEVDVNCNPAEGGGGGGGYFTKLSLNQVQHTIKNKWTQSDLTSYKNEGSQRSKINEKA